MILMSVPFCICLVIYKFIFYRGIHVKGSGDVVSAVCSTIIIIYPSLGTQTAETTSPKPFSCIPLCISCVCYCYFIVDIFICLVSLCCFKYVFDVIVPLFEGSHTWIMHNT